MTNEAKRKEVGFEPINRAHAIVETVFGCEFSSPMGPESVKRLLELEKESDLAKELPVLKKIEAMGVLFQPDDNGFRVQEEVSSKVVGVSLQRVSPTGAPTWVIQASEDTIAVHCFEYTKWEQVWANAQRYFSEILLQILPDKLTLKTVMLKYIDLFVFQGDYETEYNPHLLFDKCAHYIHPRGLKSGAKWHCHTGWFETYDLPQECLNQLNIDNVILQNGNHHTRIEHNQMFRNLNVNIDDLLDPAVLNDFMVRMHTGNKLVLKNLLTSQMAKRISL